MILELQSLIYQKLNCLSILAKITGIYYHVPANINFPYIYIGDFHNILKQDELSFKLTIFLREKSLKPMLELAKEIKSLLVSNLDITLKCLDEKIQLQNDGVTHQIILAFRAKNMLRRCYYI